MSQVFLALLSSSEPSFEYSITGEQLLIYVLHDESTYTYLWCCHRVLRMDILNPGKGSSD
jgi:hypothetical protein